MSCKDNARERRPPKRLVFLPQDIMLKIKNWVVEEKKHIRFYHDWNDKEV